jgi:hypothetical protein
MLAAVAVGVLVATGAFAEAAPFVTPLENEPPPKLIVEAPIASGLARGAALIPYRVENVRVLPLLGAGVLTASPRVGHLHVTVDDLPWHWADFSGDNVVVVVGFAPGKHKVLIDLADAEHKVLDSQTVTFTVTGSAASHAH